MAGGSEYLVAVKTLLKETDESTQEMLQEAVVMASSVAPIPGSRFCLGSCRQCLPPGRVAVPNLQRELVCQSKSYLKMQLVLVFLFMFARARANTVGRAVWVVLFVFLKDKH